MRRRRKIELIRKERPVPGPRPPAKPPAPTGIRAPGDAGKSGGMICPGSDRR